MISLFRKKKKDEEEELEDKEKVKKPRKPKKEPPRPWTKKDRIIVFLLLISTVGGSATLALSARSWKLSKFNLNFLPNFSLHKTYVLEGRSNEDFSKVIGEFKNITQDATGVYSFYVTRVYRHSSYGYRNLDKFDADSLAQLVVLAHLYKSAENGEVSLKDSYTLKRSDKVGGLGLKFYQPGSPLTYRELAAEMCSNSDALAEKIILNALGTESTQAATQQYLFSDTDIAAHSTTVSDIGFFLKRLVESDFLDSQYQEEYLDCLRKGSDKLGNLTQGQFVYKYDLKPRQASIAGVVFSSKPYVVVIVGDGIIESEAEELLPKIVKMIDEFES